MSAVTRCIHQCEVGLLLEWVSPQQSWWPLWALGGPSKGPTCVGLERQGMKPCTCLWVHIYIPWDLKNLIFLTSQEYSQYSCWKAVVEEVPLREYHNIHVRTWFPRGPVLQKDRTGINHIGSMAEQARWAMVWKLVLWLNLGLKLHIPLPLLLFLLATVMFKEEWIWNFPVC